MVQDIPKVKTGSREISYKYDKDGNITELTTAEGTIQYTYDELGQLVREDNPVLGSTIGYVYDLGRNIKAKKTYDYLPTKDMAGLEQVQPKKEVAYVYDASWKDLLWKYDGQVITYDAIGNPLKYRGMDFAWTNRNQLTQVTKAGVSTTYRYNKDGVRSRKYMTDGTVTYQLQGSTIAGEQKILTGSTNPQYEMEYFYDSAGNILSMLYNGTEYYYEKNGQGDIIGIVNGQGTEVVTYQYDSWGKVLKSGGDQTIGKRNPFRYHGYYYDEETGLYYVSSRYYDPEIGRFISADDSNILFEDQGNILENNLYAYCFNNPVNMEDLTGESPSQILGAIAGGIGGYALGKLLAKELGLKGAKRNALIAVATIGGGALGAFLGPYVAKLGRKTYYAVKKYGKKYRANI